MRYIEGRYLDRTSVKSKGEFHSRTENEGPEGERRHSSTLSLPSGKLFP